MHSVFNFTVIIHAGTADYVQITTALTLTSASPTGCIQFDVVDDTIPETVEILRISASSGTSTATAIIVIISDDGKLYLLAASVSRELPSPRFFFHNSSSGH